MDVNFLLQLSKQSLEFNQFIYNKVLSDIDNLSGKKLLDICCGTGQFIRLISPHINLIKGIDISQKCIAYAKSLNPELDYKCADVNGWNFSDIQDIVTCNFNSLNYFKYNDLISLISKIYHILSQDGEFIFDIINPDYIYRFIDIALSTPEEIDGKNIYCENHIYKNENVLKTQYFVDGKKIDEITTTNLYTLNEILELLKNTGFYPAKYEYISPLLNSESNNDSSHIFVKACKSLPSC